MSKLKAVVYRGPQVVKNRIRYAVALSRLEGGGGWVRETEIREYNGGIDASVVCAAKASFDKSKELFGDEWREKAGRTPCRSFAARLKEFDARVRTVFGAFRNEWRKAQPSSGIGFVDLVDKLEKSVGATIDEWQKIKPIA